MSALRSRSAIGRRAKRCGEFSIDERRSPILGLPSPDTSGELGLRIGLRGEHRTVAGRLDLDATARIDVDAMTGAGVAEPTPAELELLRRGAQRGDQGADIEM